MSEIVTGDKCFTSKVSDEYLDEIRDDLEEANELIAFQHHPEEKMATCVIDISRIDTELRYIH